jgi:hypothetical protein
MGAISSGNANVKQTISNVIILFNSNENKHRFCFSPGSWRTQPTPRTHVRFRLLPPSVWTLGARVLVSALRATGCAHPAPPQPNPTHSAHGGCCNWVLSIQSSTLFAVNADPRWFFIHVHLGGGAHRRSTPGTPSGRRRHPAHASHAFPGKHGETSYCTGRSTRGRPRPGSMRKSCRSLPCRPCLWRSTQATALSVSPLRCCAPLLSLS